MKECKENVKHMTSEDQLVEKVIKKETKKAERQDKISIIVAYIIIEILAFKFIPWQTIKYIIMILFGICLIAVIINPGFLEDNDK